MTWLAHTVVADSGYGSEENYRFMSENGMEAYVKYNYFHMEQRPRFKPDPFKAENFYYNEEQDFCICPMGQKMQRIGTRHVKTASGHADVISVQAMLKDAGFKVPEINMQAYMKVRSLIFIGIYCWIMIGSIIITL